MSTKRTVELKDALPTSSVDPEWNNLITLCGRSTYRFFNNLPFADLRTLGVKVIEGECPGSTYFEAELEDPHRGGQCARRSSGGRYPLQDQGS
jgi:hypothetical protein